MIAFLFLFANDRAFTADIPEFPKRLFNYNEQWSLEWYEADSSCTYDRGIHDYFLLRFLDRADTGYVNAPLSMIVRPESITQNVLMAKRCGLKKSWFIYDFTSHRYLISGVRFNEAEIYWKSLGNESVRLVKARHPGKHLTEVDVPMRLPTKEERSVLGRMLFAPIAAIIVFLSMLSIKFGFRYRINRFGSDYFKMQSSILGSVVCLSFLFIGWYIISR